MRKSLRNLRKGLSKTMRRTRSQSLKRSLNEPPNQPLTKSPTTNAVFVNDFPDGDNEGSASLWARWLARVAINKGTYIGEGHRINGYFMTGEEFDACLSLIPKLSPPEPNGFKPIRILLGGTLDDEYINNPDLKADGKELTEKQRDLVSILLEIHTNTSTDPSYAAEMLQTSREWRSRGCHHACSPTWNRLLYLHEDFVQRAL